MNLLLKSVSIFSAVAMLVPVAEASAEETAPQAGSVANPVQVPQTGLRAGRIDMEGSFLTPLQQRDSVLIADQLLYGFSLENVPEGTGIAFPDWSKGFCEGVEVLTPWQIDTVAVEKGKKGQPSRMNLKAGVIVTSFDEGTYQLPPISVLRRTPDGRLDTLFFESRTMEVRTMPVDTATFELHDIKGQIRYPVTFMEVLPWLAGAIVLAGLIVLVIWLVRRYRRNGGLAAARKDPPHIVALRKLDGLRGNKLWAPEKQKAFYSGVTDALREYIVSRYGMSAMEMTTKEIFDGLSDKDVPADLYDEMKVLFERADFVKFAKYVASDEENASVVPSAVRFVTQTYQQEVDVQEDAAAGQDTGDASAAGQKAQESEDMAGARESSSEGNVENGEK